MTTQLAAEVAQLKKGVDGLQSLVSRREEEARGKDDGPSQSFLNLCERLLTRSFLFLVLNEKNHALAKELEEAEGHCSREAEEHDRLCIAVDPLRELLNIEPPRSTADRVEGAEAMPQRSHALTIASL